jgi:SPP1 family phage portal protein
MYITETQRVNHQVISGVAKTDSEIIKDMISEHQAKRNEILDSYAKYKGNTDIKQRQFTDSNKINNKLSNDFIGDIVDSGVGYFMGQPITYEVTQDVTSLQQELKSFVNRNNIEDLDSTTAEDMAIAGYGARLLYIDKNGKERVMRIHPAEAHFRYNASIDELDSALVYYNYTFTDGTGKEVTRKRAELYDKKFVKFYLETEKGDFEPDFTTEKKIELHTFDFVPLIRFDNNSLLNNDFAKVEDLINCYDRTISDIQNEIEEFRLAYFGFMGADPPSDEEQIKLMQRVRQTGAFFFPENTDGKFITKPLDSASQFIENHKQTLNDNIYKFSKAVDMRDDRFTNAPASGESRKWKLVNLENKTIIKERKFKKALREQFKVLCSALQKKSIKLNYEDITYQFKRSLPIDLQYYAEVNEKLIGKVSNKTRLSLMPFVEDVTAEILEMQDEAFDPLQDREITE